jgi:hypothetical protein
MQLGSFGVKGLGIHRFVHGQVLSAGVPKTLAAAQSFTPLHRGCLFRRRHPPIPLDAVQWFQSKPLAVEPERRGMAQSEVSFSAKAQESFETVSS